MNGVRRLIERFREESGAAMIEFALVAPLLLVLVWGIIETGRAFYTINSLASAVRDGARYGAASCPLGSPGKPDLNACIVPIQQIVTSSFQAIGDSLLSAGVEADTVRGGTAIEVVATYPYVPIVPIGWDTIFMVRRAVFRYERLP